MYRFYKKQVSNPITILKHTAMPESKKVATFSNEILRRLKTTHVEVSQTEMEGTIMTLMDELSAMGYAQEWKEKVLRAALIGYMRILEKVRKKEAPRNRKGAETLTSRRFKKLMGNQEWFRIDNGKPDTWEIQEPWDNSGKRKSLQRRRTPDSRYIESVFFVPHTPESSLKNRLTKMEQGLKFNTSFRYCESMGRSIRELLVKKDPASEHSGRESYFPCQSKVGSCRRQGGIYRISCNTCKEKGQKESVYIGETARTLLDRGFEHLKAMETRNEDSPLVEHALE